MGLSRRTFTKEINEVTVRQLKLRASVAEVACACEVNPNVLQRWRYLTSQKDNQSFGRGDWRPQRMHTDVLRARRT
jgi:transposase-like protein